VYGEVIKKHLTIGKADKQGDSAQFGEVLHPLFSKTFSVNAAQSPMVPEPASNYL
jgi:hypothetical protein